jgi:serine/threonine protein kinase
MNCPNQGCNEIVEPDWNKCPSCQTPLQMLCPNTDCKYKIKPHWSICPKCDTPLSGSQTPSVGRLGQSSGSPQASGSPVVSMLGQDTQAESGIIFSNGERLLNRFTIKKSLGRGGFGAVYLAEDGERKHDIALKVVTTNIGQAEMAATQIRNELTLRDKINDFTHIIRTYDIHTMEAYKGLSLILMPMEYAEGNSFRNFLAENKRDDERRRKEGVDLFKQACKGVKAIHDAGLVHCDLKPENILICKDHKGQTVAKVSDFGISRNVDQWSMNQAAVIQSSLGTPYYMSPEQVKTARQKDIDGRADIYALGVILFEILDGDPPFDGTAEEVRKKHLEMKPPKLKGVDGEYVGVVNKCLEKDPEKRYQGIEELIEFKNIPKKKAPPRKNITRKSSPKEAKKTSMNAPRYQLRSEPLNVSDAECKFVFNVACRIEYLGIENYENRIETKELTVFIENDYKDNHDGTVTDHATGLMWQKSAESGLESYREANICVASLNRARFAGYSNWRLPTINELSSLAVNEPLVSLNKIFNENTGSGLSSYCSADKKGDDYYWDFSFFFNSVSFSLIVDGSLFTGFLSRSVLAVRSI